MPNEVTIPQPDNTTRINIPFDIPNVIYGSAIEKYAKRLFGWTSKIIENGVEIDNPVSAIDSIAKGMRDQARANFAAIVREEAADQAANQAEQQFNVLFNA